MVTPSMRTLVLVLAASALGGTACDTKKSAPTTTGDAGTTSASGTASSASQGAVAAGPGCALVTRGGAVLPKLAPGTLSIAAAHGKALVVDATFAAPPAGEKESPVPTAHAERILLNGAGAPDGDMTPIFDALPQGPGVLTFANAMSFQGELTTVSFAAKRPAPAECTDGVLALNGARAGGGATRHELVTHACRPATDVRGAARHDLGIVFTDGLAANEPSSPSPPAVANVWILDKLTTAPLRAESVAGTAPVAIEAPAVAAGTTIVAAAWVVARGAARELHAAHFGRKGEMIGTVAVLDKQGVGTVTLAFEGDTLHVVWSSFAADKNRYTLKWLKWPAAGAPTTPQNIGTGVLPAYAPALAIDGGRFLLAWTEGDDRTASVKVGASRNGIANIPGLATVASTLGTMGSGPAVAEEGDAMFVVWKEKGALAEVRSSALKCQE